MSYVMFLTHGEASVIAIITLARLLRIQPDGICEHSPLDSKVLYKQEERVLFWKY